MVFENVEKAENEITILGHHLTFFFACFLGENPEKRISRLMDITRKADQKNRKRWGKEFHGEGFIENAGNILKRISRDPKVKMKIVTREDDFCKKCRHLDVCRWSMMSTQKDEREFIETIGCEVNKIYSSDELLKMGEEFIRLQENQTFIFRSWIGQKLLSLIKSLGD